MKALSQLSGVSQSERAARSVEEQRLVGDESDFENKAQHVYHTPRKGLNSRLLFAHIAILVANILIVTFVVRKISTSHCGLDRDVIRGVDIQNEEVIFHNLSGNPFAGPAPNTTIDDAWEKLLTPMNIRASEDELRVSGQSSVKLPEQGGYLVWFGVFHELHCIKMLRHWIYREHYFKDLQGSDFDHMASHADHCIEMLRQSSMCHADRSLTVFKWVESSVKPMFDASESRHQCIDWAALMKSVEHRVVDDTEIKQLVNPLLET